MTFNCGVYKNFYKKKSVKESNNKLLFLTDFELLLTNLY